MDIFDILHLMDDLDVYKTLITKGQEQPKSLAGVDRQRGIIPKGGMEQKDFMTEALPKAQRVYLDILDGGGDEKLQKQTADSVFEMKGVKGSKTPSSGNMFVLGDKALEGMMGALRSFGSKIKDVEDAEYEVSSEGEEGEE